MLNIFDSYHLISESEASRLLTVLMAGKSDLLIPKSKKQPEYLNLTSLDNSEYASNSPETASAGSVAVIPIMGVLTRGGEACSLGTDEMIEIIDRANADPAVGSIVFQINSPGGSVGGIMELADAIKNSKKPTLASVQVAGSAACWLAVQCQYVYLENSLTSSIGSMSAFYVYQNIGKQLAQEGVSVEIIRADNSAKKFKPNSIEPITEAERAEIVLGVTKVKTQFMAAVVGGRGERFLAKEEYFDGQMFDSQTAISIGLADGIAPFKATLKAAFGLAASNLSNQFQTNMHPLIQSLSARLGLSGDTQISENEVSAKFDALILEKDNQLAIITASTQAISKKLEDAEATAKTTIEQLNATIAAKDAEIQTLETQVTNAPKPIVPQTDALMQVQTYATQMEALPDGHPDKEIFKTWQIANS